MKKKISEIEYRNEFISVHKGIDSIVKTPAITEDALYSLATPVQVPSPSLVSWSKELAKTLNLSSPDEQDDLGVLSGNFIVSSMKPYAACYGGFQFGNWANQLGDGRAITLGEIHQDQGVFEIQLKGAGKTAYSRRGDGKAVLRSSVREYLMSEAMFFLGVPTTRALSLITTGEDIIRDMFYDGNVAFEPGAIVTRVAPTFLRFGNFQILAARGEKENLEKLVDWSVKNFFKNINSEGDQKIIDFYKSISSRTAHMIVEWMRVGFVHGVMNTDNMSILGLTIDYGPYSFVDNFDPQFTPNTTDLPGRRYSFDNQAGVAFWNLERFADSLLPLMSDKNLLKREVDQFKKEYRELFFNMMGRKLGLDHFKGEDSDLIQGVFEVLASLKIDMTIFFQELIDVNREETSSDEVINHFKKSFYRDLEKFEKRDFFNIIKIYKQRLKENIITSDESKEIMTKANPRFILRNYLLFSAIEKLESGDDSLYRELEMALKTPYSKEHDKFYVLRPDWAEEKGGCSMLSCSS